MTSLRAGAAALAGLAAALSPAWAEIPEAPATSDFVWDRARLLRADDEAEVRAIQRRVAQAHNVPLVVVTIERMSDYVDRPTSIEAFAREWFDTWQIGSERENTGILLLVSQGDRKARIELGADWGRRWDGYCQRLMEQEIVARFKRQDFSGGIRAGVVGLETMAGLGPAGVIPQPGPLEKLQNSETLRQLRATQPLPVWAANLLILGGVALMVGSIWVPDHRTLMLVVGALMVAAGITLYLLVFILGAFSKGKGRSGSSYSGFGGGGFSGGGGATGSW